MASTFIDGIIIRLCKYLSHWTNSMEINLKKKKNEKNPRWKIFNRFKWLFNHSCLNLQAIDGILLLSFKLDTNKNEKLDWFIIIRSRIWCKACIHCKPWANIYIYILIEMNLIDDEQLTFDVPNLFGWNKIISNDWAALIMWFGLDEAHMWVELQPHFHTQSEIDWIFWSVFFH